MNQFFFLFNFCILQKRDGTRGKIKMYKKGNQLRSKIHEINKTPGLWYAEELSTGIKHAISSHDSPLDSIQLRLCASCAWYWKFIAWGIFYINIKKSIFPASILHIFLSFFRPMSVCVCVSVCTFSVFSQINQLLFLYTFSYFLSPFI